MIHSKNEIEDTGKEGQERGVIDELIDILDPGDQDEFFVGFPDCFLARPLP